MYLPRQGQPLHVMRLWYMTFMGDGDSSSYGRVAKLKLYGLEHLVEKEECAGLFKNGWGKGYMTL